MTEERMYTVALVVTLALLIPVFAVQLLVEVVTRGG